MKYFKYLIAFYALALLGCKSSSSPIQKEAYFLVAGQSNAMGVGDKEKSLQQNNSNVLEYNSKNDTVEPLNDPIGQQHLGFQKAQTGSFIPALGHTYYEITNNPVLVVQTAKGGSSLTEDAETNDWGNWSPSGKLFQNSITKVKMMQSYLTKKRKASLDAIFWSQGENDGQAISNHTITKQDYKNALIDLIERYYSHLGDEVPFIIIETGRSDSSPARDKGFAKVREAQREVAQEMNKVYIGYDETEFFIERDWLKDVVHYNQIALNDIGEKLAYFFSSLEK